MIRKLVKYIATQCVLGTMVSPSNGNKICFCATAKHSSCKTLVHRAAQSAISDHLATKSHIFKVSMLLLD